MTAPTPLRPFALDAVRIGDASVFARARDEMLHLARAYPVDRLLAVFRRNAGLDTRGAAPPGNWEDFGHANEEPWSETDYPGRERAQTANLLRGHYAGHFLSMLATAAAGERDRSLRAKADELVTGLGEVQDGLAATGRYSHPGFLAAYGEWQFSRLEDFAPYGEIWAPYYTCHKIMAGLLDSHLLTGSDRALEVATAMGHWVHHRLSRLEPERRQRMWSIYIAGEFGGMNETLARLATAAAEPVFTETAAFFDQQNLLEAGASGTDILDDMHANQHLPQLIGYVEQYELTGERRYLEASKGIWNQIVPGRTYAHGGTGESELWGPPETVAGDIGHRNAETCASYNLLKLARKLFEHTREARYMDYYERTVLNHILGSRKAVRSETSPEVTYMFPVHAGALREYDNVGTCCGGTGLENHVKYQEAVLLRADDGLYVNLPFDAEADWDEAGLRIRIDSGYPFGGELALRFDALAGAEPDLAERTVRVRVPDWVAGEPALSLNGEPTGVQAVPGEYSEITRAWRPGDELRLGTPAALLAEAAIDDPSLSSLRLGATVLLARSDSTTRLRFPSAGRLDGGRADGRTGAELLSELARDGTVRLDGVDFEPCWSGLESRYHMYVRSKAAEDAYGGGPDGPGVAIEVLEEPAPSGWYTIAPTIRLRAFGSGEETADRTGLELRIAGGDWTPYTGPVRITAEGEHLIEARLRGPDGAAATVSRELSVDTRPPESHATVKDLGAAVEITLHAVDDVSGVERVQWEGPGTFWGTFQEAFVRAIDDEPQVIEFAATDRAGNEEPRRRLVLPAREGSQ